MGRTVDQNMVAVQGLPFVFSNCTSFCLIVSYHVWSFTDWVCIILVCIIKCKIIYSQDFPFTKCEDN
jgi:hypothetical protein